MAARTGNRFPLSQVASLARAETKFLARAVGRVIRHLTPIVGVGGRIHRFGSRCRPRRGYSAPPRLLCDRRGRRTGAALGDARSAPGVAGNHSQDVLHDADRRSLHSRVLHSSGVRPAVDLGSPSRHICARRAVCSGDCRFVRRPAANCGTRSRFIADLYLRGRLSGHGGVVDWIVDAAIGIVFSVNRRDISLVCAVSGDGLRN